MTQPVVREVEHEITVAAPAREVYRLIAEVENWPRIFPPTIHVDQASQGAGQERIRVWATANGAPKNWTSQRALHPDTLRIDFRQEVSTPPVAAMGGAWIIEPLSAGQSRVRLLHDYRAIDDDPGGLAWIDQAVDGNSRSELAALRANLEFVVGSEKLTWSFEDTVHIHGSPKDVYDFINEADLWSERLPHVARVNLQEPEPGLQELEMDTRSPNGSVHTTKSYRVCFPYDRIVYKQTTLPVLMSLHTGRWSFLPTVSGVAATSQHTVVLRPENVTSVLGPDAGIAEGREHVQHALSTNSRTTLGYAKTYAESRV
ncbi:aromatase/cyclase [Streptomyces sp. NRRL F-5123]|uniref:aromatase/cyclase n=1 Tax=Streptomyces sp. NRRL F-5123 TaxID=1463856 RepID=UPI0004E19881|nr:aromatase/cyclase [Streptomyces sp. NRRL F-5123]